MSFKFLPEHFKELHKYEESYLGEVIAARANGLLQAHLGTLPRMTVIKIGEDWWEAKSGISATELAECQAHIAYLFNLEPIEPCRHLNTSDIHLWREIGGGGFYKCPDCGARMKRIVSWVVE